MSYSGQPEYDPPPYVANPVSYPPPPPTVVYQTVGNCLVCRQGSLSSNVTVLGILCCILLFPLGLICLFLLQEQRCSRCRYRVYGSS